MNIQIDNYSTKRTCISAMRRMYIRKCDFQIFLVMEIFGRTYGCFLKTCHFKTSVQCFRQSTDKLTMTLVYTDAWVSLQDGQLLFSSETVS